MGLDDPRLDQLIELINSSFRVHENHDPVYVDVGGHLGRVAAPQHQVIFGRRGSGKSCLLVHYLRTVTPDEGTLAIYVNADEIKTLAYPDLLIRLLLTILESTPPPRRHFSDWVRRRPSHQSSRIAELRALLAEAETAEVTRQRATRRADSAKGTVDLGRVGVSSEQAIESSEASTAQFVERKKDYLDRHLQDIKHLLRDAIKSGKYERGALIVDDFYLIHPTVQPDVVDYLYRLLRGTDFYLKVATVRHRSRLARYDGRLIGIELGQDVEMLSLDQTFEDVAGTQAYLAEMLDSLGRQVGIKSVSDEFLSTDGLFALTFASGGVPRDYLTIFIEAVGAARAEERMTRVTPRSVYRGAARVSYRTKLSNLRSDAGPDALTLERVFTDLLAFTLKEKRKTAFLVSQEEAAQLESAHELIQQLMDFKLVHVVVPDTSAASGRPGRYEAYTLDAASFMEPRRRNIELVEFWKTDDQRRPRGIREAPVYPLTRAEGASTRETEESTEKVLAELEAEAVEGPDGTLPG